ncbi:TPA: hypothetical protein MD644_004475 [Klebsiella pneumoniae]|uniref:hypothetical protein n=1 Tax=Klebsiella pneumoniae TaxID=573 RepID=UPI0007D6D1CE|nr:hypothetical protein [Klebsiella pneumoniae]MBQ5054146.1 hypothetical protein [Klebsiella pneumoniae]HBQ1178065.1 hypothetical protein [Klebsiella pneumoniae]HBR7360803.1 hypothetical protein [Klebsiella pneumoniae]HBS3303827.1 hypothetical protein [Klebsiella pneumoniae]HBV7924251.1 hypothetical protein [Klebsiella pneumoniae]
MSELETKKAKQQGAIEALMKVRVAALAMGTMTGINDPEAGKAIYEIINGVVEQVLIGYPEVKA